MESKDDGTPVPTSEEKQKNETSAVNRSQAHWTCFYLLVVLIEVLSVIAIALVIHWAREYFGGYAWDGSGQMFNWHPLLMILGMIVCYGNAAISYRVFSNSPKFTIKLVHAGLHFFALLFTIIGLFAVFGFHNHNKIPNMYSLHSWVGMATVILFGCQYVMGFLGFLVPKFSDDLRATYLGIHVFFGGVILAMAVVACVSGLTEKLLFSSPKLFNYSKFPAPGNIANVLGLVLASIAVAVGYIIYNPNYKRVEEYESFE